MTTYFVSDLHLDDARPEATALFLRFLAGAAREARTLHVLGDLFEAWVGDDDDAPLAQQVADAIRAVRDSGVRVAFIHGNRDVLLGTDYADRAGMELLPESVVEEVEGTPTLLMHGDTLCTADIAYQAFRTQSRHPAWRAAALSRPLAERRAMASKAREESRRHTGTVAAEIMDVAPAAVLAALRRHDVRRLIHGHTHRLAVHGLDLDGAPAERIVLGDWYERPSALRVSPEGLEFVPL